MAELKFPSLRAFSFVPPGNTEQQAVSPSRSHLFFQGLLASHPPAKPNGKRYHPASPNIPEDPPQMLGLLPSALRSPEGYKSSGCLYVGLISSLFGAYPSSGPHPKSLVYAKRSSVTTSFNLNSLICSLSSSSRRIRPSLSS